MARGKIRIGASGWSYPAWWGAKAGPVLFQLPPQMEADAQRLADFAAMLDGRWRYAFEFRHRSWYADKILDILRAHDLALCISDHADAPTPWVRTASFFYVRGHGPSGRYHGNYSDETLEDWTKTIRKWRAKGADAWCFFDNDVKSAAPCDAARLKALLGAKDSTPKQVPRQIKRKSAMSR